MMNFYMISKSLAFYAKCGSYDLCDTTAIGQTIMFSYVQMQGKFSRINCKCMEILINFGGSKCLNCV